MRTLFIWYNYFNCIGVSIKYNYHISGSCNLYVHGTHLSYCVEVVLKTKIILSDVIAT